MRVIDLDSRAGGDRAWAAKKLRDLADKMAAGEITDVVYAARAPTREITFGVATAAGLIGLESAGMAVWLLHWIQNEAEFDE